MLTCHTATTKNSSCRKNGVSFQMTVCVNKRCLDFNQNSAFTIIQKEQKKSSPAALICAVWRVFCRCFSAASDQMMRQYSSQRSRSVVALPEVVVLSVPAGVALVTSILCCFLGRLLSGFDDRCSLQPDLAAAPVPVDLVGAADGFCLKGRAGTMSPHQYRDSLQEKIILY